MYKKKEGYEPGARHNKLSEYSHQGSVLTRLIMGGLERILVEEYSSVGQNLSYEGWIAETQVVWMLSVL